MAKDTKDFSIRRELLLYIHGKGGSAAESEHYKPLFPGREVLGLSWQADTPWDAGAEIRSAVMRLKAEYTDMTLIANSIGVCFSMYAGIGPMLRRAYFISPIVDLERLILDMMERAGVTEQALQEQSVIRASFGEELSWAYLCRVRAFPVQWTAPTEILYGSRDGLTDRETMAAFVKAHGAGLTVMERGEHWFHTEAQLRFLDRWIENCEAGIDAKRLMGT